MSWSGGTDQFWIFTSQFADLIPGGAVGIRAPIVLDPPGEDGDSGFETNLAPALPADEKAGVLEDVIGDLVGIVGPVGKNDRTSGPSAEVGRGTVEGEAVVNADRPGFTGEIFDFGIVFPEVGFLASSAEASVRLDMVEGAEAVAAFDHPEEAIFGGGENLAIMFYLLRAEEDFLENKSVGLVFLQLLGRKSGGSGIHVGFLGFRAG